MMINDNRFLHEGVEGFRQSFEQRFPPHGQTKFLFVVQSGGPASRQDDPDRGG